jgi:hypothetical protein
MKSEYVQGNDNNQAEKRGDKQDHNDLVSKRLSLLYGWLEAFNKQFLADAVDANRARRRANEHHPKTPPSTPPIQSTCWKK